MNTGALNRTGRRQVLSGSDLKRQGQRYLNSAYSGISLEDDVKIWAQRVVSTGGAAPQLKTLQTLSTFIRDLKNYQIYHKMKSVNCYVPTDLATAMVPLLAADGLTVYPKGGSSQVWVAADLTIAGLKGNGAKALDTGLITNRSPYTDESIGVGLTLCVSEGVSEVVRDIGGWWGGYWCNIHLNIGNQVDWRAGAAPVQNVAYTPGIAAFVSCSRLNSKLTTEFGSSTVNWTKGTPAAVTEAPHYCSGSIFVFACNENGAMTYPCSKRYSFSAIHTGLETTAVDEPALLYAAVQKMRRSLGGGWV